jgi:predicted metalloprotease
MRWDDFRQSDNVEDYRGAGPVGGGGGGMPGGAGGLGIGTVLVLGLVGWALGIDPRLLIGGMEMLQGGGPSQYQQTQRPQHGPAPTDETGRFIRGVLGETEDRWSEIFQKAGKRYVPPSLAIFRGRLPTGGCGLAQTAMGPFYCPGDRTIYLDSAFFNEIETRFHGCQGKACRFSQAYVIAHEVGHHVQNLLGILPKVQQMQRGMDRGEGNQLQVRVELQADCFAGVWANHEKQKRNFLEPGDVDAALQTASAIGDDTLQRRATGTVVPDSFTHGTSEQRKRWFTSGFMRGTLAACNTFDASTRL